MPVSGVYLDIDVKSLKDLEKDGVERGSKFVIKS